MAALATAIAARFKGKKRAPDAVDEEEDVPDETTDEGGEPPGMDALEPDEGTAAEEDMGSYDSVEDSAVADMMSAAKTGDAETFKSALRDFVQACIDRGGE